MDKREFLLECGQACLPSNILFTMKQDTQPDRALINILGDLYCRAKPGKMKKAVKEAIQAVLSSIDDGYYK